MAMLMYIAIHLAAGIDVVALLNVNDRELSAILARDPILHFAIVSMLIAAWPVTLFVVLGLRIILLVSEKDGD